jgi:predicted site-specific integrase-resolvase
MKNTEKEFEEINEIEPLLRERAVSEILGVSYYTLRKTFRYGGLISYVKYKKGVRYRPSDVRKFIKEHLIVVN